MQLTISAPKPKVALTFIEKASKISKFWTGCEETAKARASQYVVVGISYIQGDHDKIGFLVHARLHTFQHRLTTAEQAHSELMGRQVSREGTTKLHASGPGRDTAEDLANRQGAEAPSWLGQWGERSSSQEINQVGRDGSGNDELAHALQSTAAPGRLQHCAQMLIAPT